MASQVTGGPSLDVQPLFSIDERWLVGEKFLLFHRGPLCRPSVVGRELLGEEVLSLLQRQLKESQNSTALGENKTQTNAIDQHREFSSSGSQFGMWLLLLFVRHNLTHICSSENGRMSLNEQGSRLDVRIEQERKPGVR